MDKIRNIAFDLGGVVVALSHENAIRCFEQLGLKDAREHLDAFCQHGIFGDLENGSITPEAFRSQLSLLVGRTLSMDECYQAWHGYVESVPQRNLDMLLQLREKGYKVCLLSNTNPFMMQWAFSPAFSVPEGNDVSNGHPIDYYFDHLYLSYECKVMKPSPDIFRKMLEGQQATPEETLFIDDSPRNVEVAASLGIHTICPHNNENWIPALMEYCHIPLERITSGQ